MGAVVVFDSNFGSSLPTPRRWPWWFAGFVGLYLIGFFFAPDGERWAEFVGGVVFYEAVIVWMNRNSRYKWRTVAIANLIMLAVFTWQCQHVS